MKLTCECASAGKKYAGGPSPHFFACGRGMGAAVLCFTCPAVRVDAVERYGSAVPVGVLRASVFTTVRYLPPANTGALVCCARI